MPSSGPGKMHMAPTSANQIRINAVAGYLVISLLMVVPACDILGTWATVAQGAAATYAPFCVKHSRRLLSSR